VTGIAPPQVSVPLSAIAELGTLEPIAKNMTQIFDIQVPSNQTIQQAIINIHGIGRNRSEQFCQYIGLPRSTTLGSLSLKKRN
jgi:hypothetical protein